MCEQAKLPLLVEYSEHTTYHGIKYIFRTKQSIFERIFWIVILTTLMFVLGYFVYTNVSRFLQFQLKVQKNQQPTHVFELPFPAVTICPANKVENINISESAVIEHFMKFVNQSASDVWNSEYGSMLVMATQVCRKTLGDYIPKMIKILANRTSLNLTAPTELTNNMIFKLDQMSPDLQTIQFVQFANFYDNELTEYTDENVGKLFNKIITNDGLCFTFNTVSDILRSSLNNNNNIHIFNPYYYFRDGWDPETGYTKHIAYPFKGIFRGENETNGLTVELVNLLFGCTELCSPSQLGYKLLLHSPTEYPHTYEKYLSLDFGTDYTIVVKPETIKTAHSLRSIRPEIRKCYFNDERPLKYYTFYNENNCKLECYANFTLKMYGGFPFWSPSDRYIPKTVLKSHNYGWYLPNYYSSVYAYNQIYKNSHNLNSTFDMDCKCLPVCNSIGYDYEIADNHVNMMNIRSTLDGDTLARTLLKIIYQQPTFIGKERVEEYTFASLVSIFGGLLGLFMGGSIISIFEVIYFFVIRNFAREP